MPTYLLEIGTEELPAHHVSEAQERLKSLLSDALKEANVGFGDMTTMGTPRRLTCLIKDLAAVQDTVQEKRKGPPVKSSFDDAGKPNKAAIGFADKAGLKVEQLDREEIGGAEYLIANLTIQGKPVADVLKDVVPKTILQLSGERPMRWGFSELKFSRPIRWLVSLLDKEVVPVKIEDITAGRKTFGNRVLAPGEIEIKSPESYVDDLRKAKVVVDAAERQEIIEKQVTEAAKGVSGKPRQLGGSLLAEVVNITEWPHAIVGEIEKEYLDLPDTLIETIMIHHQRYFPVERLDGGDAEKRLLPYFVTVSNNDRPQAAPIIKQGNERVIRARLADGRFFYFDDQKTKLSERTEALANLTFQEGLGSYTEKTERMIAAARILSDSLRLDDRTSVCLERTMELCKLDLVTNLVRELPELQGYVGSWYAAQEQQPPDVVTAIVSHYAPRHSEEAIPADKVGQFAATIDKLDTLVGLFALGRRPSGSSDPYALRRQAQGVVDILVDGLQGYSVNVNALIELLLELIVPRVGKKKGFEVKKTITDLREFLLLRIRMKLQERGYRREIIEAVMNVGDSLTDVKDLIARCEAVDKIAKTEEGLTAIRAGDRIGRILKPDSAKSVDPARFDVQAEKDLWETFQKEVVAVWESEGHFKQPTSQAEYEQMLKLAGKLSKQIDQYFVDVMVNDPDVAKKNNRHGMLSIIYQYYGSVADFPKLQPLLP